MAAPGTKSKATSRRFEVSLPATSANLGPAFDAAALAFRLYLKVQAQLASDFSVSARGRDADICRQANDHLILNTYREVLQAEGRPAAPIALRLNNEIPIGKGCGSSAAARLAGIALAVHFGKVRWSGSRIIAEASRREHHPDNAAACWTGGLAVAKMSNDGETQVVKLTPKGRWPLLLVVPAEPLSTEEARRVLPTQYSRADAVANLQNSMLLLAAFVQGRSELLSAALDDRMHQPYRAPLCPLLPALQELNSHSGVLGAVLSGAGPSVLIFVDAKAAPAGVKVRVAQHLQSRGLSAELLATSISERGASDTIVVKR
jgi:homoserine kinase